VGLCPVTEANLGDGIFDGPRFRDAGGRFGVGTDSNVSVDAAGELRQLEYSQRLARRARNLLAAPGASTGLALFEAALAGGAAALGQGRPGLAVGAPADIVSLATDHPALAGHGTASALDAWVFAGGAALVDSVWTRGRLQVAGGRHRQRDAVRRRFAATMARLAAL
jgi:cytosine/adenosine deaminase-related metal-dependent hydrolase